MYTTIRVCVVILVQYLCKVLCKLKCTSTLYMFCTFYKQLHLLQQQSNCTSDVLNSALQLLIKHQSAARRRCPPPSAPPPTQGFEGARAPGPLWTVRACLFFSLATPLSLSLSASRLSLSRSAVSRLVSPQATAASPLSGAQPGFWFRGEAINKICSKVARISVRGGDIQQKFTQQRLENFFKFYIKFAQKFKKFSKMYQDKINKIFKKF